MKRIINVILFVGYFLSMIMIDVALSDIINSYTNGWAKSEVIGMTVNKGVIVLLSVLWICLCIMAALYLDAMMSNTPEEK